MSFLSAISAEMLVSIVLCGLLIGVIALALRLDARLKTVRDSSGELHSLINGLNQATERAHQAVSQMSAAAKEHKGTLEASIVKARDLSDELTLITQSADSLANRLSGTPQRAPVQPAETNHRQSPPRSVVGQSPVQPQEDNPRDMLKKIIAGVR